MRRLTTLLMMLCPLLPMTAGASEYSLEYTTGKRPLLQGYSLRSADRYKAPPVPIYLNRRHQLDGKTWGDLSTEKQWLLFHAILVATGAYENVPTARVRFQIAGAISIDAYLRPDGSNMFSGSHANHVTHRTVRMIDGDPVTVEADFQVSLNDPRIQPYSVAALRHYDPSVREAALTARAWIAAITMHELGHALGFAHSYLAPEVARPVTGATSPGSIMCYPDEDEEAAFLQIARNGALNPDDIATLSRGYPNPFEPLAASSGTIRGVVLRDIPGGLPWSRPIESQPRVLGASVLAIRRDPGGAWDGAVLSWRLSGYAGSRPAAGVHHGQFELNGLPPGTYDLVVLSKQDRGEDPRFRLHRPLVTVNYSQVGSFEGIVADRDFDTGVPRGWVRGIEILPGETVDLGYVVAGRDRPVDAPAQLDVRLSQRPDRGYDEYSLEFLSEDRTEHYWVDWQAATTFETRLRSKRYRWRLWGRTGGDAAIASGWNGLDCRAGLFVGIWRKEAYARPHWEGGTREALAHSYRLHRNLGSLIHRIRHLDSTIYTTYSLPGTWKVTVTPREAPDLAPASRTPWEFTVHSGR